MNLDGSSPVPPLNLNLSALRCVSRLTADAQRLGVAVTSVPGGGLLIDCGVEARGGLEAGRLLAETCLAARGQVQLTRGRRAGSWSVEVLTDQPWQACMASQYAGWQLAGKYDRGGEQKSFFAMGSGPMRAAAGREALMRKLGAGDDLRLERPDQVVGVLETATLPPPQLFAQIAEACQLEPRRVVLLAARTASIAGSLQVVARSVETALHKLAELDFDVRRIRSAAGSAPLPCIAGDDLTAIGWTNDAVLYGADVTLWVDADDRELAEIGPRIPSSASREHGRPFAEIFKSHNGNFYEIDPQLFSPAVVRLMNLRSGREHRFGAPVWELIPGGE